MQNINRIYFVILAIIVGISMSIFLTGCAISGCGNPQTSSTSTMTDSNNTLIHEASQPEKQLQEGESLDSRQAKPPSNSPDPFNTRPWLRRTGRV